MTQNKRVIIIAGPNGAGKTTFAHEFLPHEAGCPVFVNADLIAAGLSPFTPEAVAFRAGRLMLNELDLYYQNGVSFAFETTLSGRTYLDRIATWRSNGYRIELIFLSLNRVEEAIARVSERVQQGGHSIPESVIRRRFRQGIVNFHDLYAPIVDAWVLYDNSGPTPVLIDWSER